MQARRVEAHAHARRAEADLVTVGHGKVPRWHRIPAGTLLSKPVAVAPPAPAALLADSSHDSDLEVLRLRIASMQCRVHRRLRAEGVVLASELAAMDGPPLPCHRLTHKSSLRRLTDDLALLVLSYCRCGNGTATSRPSQARHCCKYILNCIHVYQWIRGIAPHIICMSAS